MPNNLSMGYLSSEYTKSEYWNNMAFKLVINLNKITFLISLQFL